MPALSRAYAVSGADAEAANLQRYIDYLASAARMPAAGLATARARGAAGVLLEEAARLVIENAAPGPSPGSLSSPQDRAHVRRAEEIMHERYADPLTTGEIAAVLGVSPRRLQAAFASVRDTSPLAILRSIRIERARDRLSDASANGTVSSIAYDCGLAHLGRFAVEYRRRYGERPSETLQRARGYG
jgi:transcriptional regulator GlxA family with amidase domain